MKNPELHVMIDGELYPLRSCDWIRVDPDGHVTGTLAGEWATTPDQAHKEFTPLYRERVRENKQGYRHELVTRAHWSAHCMPCMRGQCQHVTHQPELPLDYP